jgi:hypothetical protein
MRTAHRIGIAVATAVLTAGSPASHAGTAAKHGADAPVDERLLEFLGSVDPSADSGRADGGSWLAYLAQVKIGKAPAPAQAATAPRSAAPKPSSAPAGATTPGG